MYKEKIINTLVAEIKKAGLRVFLSKRKDYGFFTDSAGTSVVSFEILYTEIKFAGKYKTNHPKSGTGWKLDKDITDYHKMLDATPPLWAIKDATARKTTLAEQLADYGESSGYTEIK